MNTNSDSTKPRRSPRSNGTHPKFKNLRIRDCMCPSQTACRKLMWSWADINATDMFPYICLPAKQKKDTPLARHLDGYRKNVAHHFYGHASSGLKKEILDSNNDLRFAMWHLPPEFRHLAHKDTAQKMNKWRVPADLGKELLTERDLTNIPDEHGNKTYYLSPICHDISEATKEVEVAEREHHATLKSPPESNSTAPTARTNPRERRIARATRNAESDAGATGRRVVELEDEVAELKKLLQKQAQESEQRESALKELNQAEKEAILKMLRETGMSRMSLCNDKFHEDKPWLAPHLYGSTWKEHKAIGDSLFAGKKVDYLLDQDNGFLREQLPEINLKDWNANVSGEGKITPFEQYSITVMIVRRDFAQETIAGMYGVSQSAISRYFTAWAPRLGRAGKDLSEIDMEMNHNIFEVDYCKQNNLPYMEKGKAYNLEEYLQLDDDLLALQINMD